MIVFRPPPPGVIVGAPTVTGPMSAADALGSYTPGNPVKTRELLYRLIVSQLFYDGYQQVEGNETIHKDDRVPNPLGKLLQVAVQLTNLLAADPPCPPSERLLNVATLGLEKEAEMKNKPLTTNEKVRGLFCD